MRWERRGAEVKRDARIGLAVVLVLGLGVTLLVGRALYKHGGPTDIDGDQLAITDTTTSGSHADPGAAPANVNSLGSRDDLALNVPPLSGSTPVPSASSGVPMSAENFIRDQSAPIEPHDKKVVGGTNKKGDLAQEPDDSNAQATPL